MLVRAARGITPRKSSALQRFRRVSGLRIGPQCGFASTAAGNPLTEDDERAKLRLIVDAARAIWG